MHPYTYKRTNHFRDWLDKVTSKEEIPQEVIDKISESLGSSFSRNDIRYVLKRNRLYKYGADQIYYKMTGLKPIDLTIPLELYKNNLKNVADQYQQHENFEFDDCPICFETITPIDYKRLECNHTFHPNCIIEWFNIKNDQSCPICRQVPIPRSDDFEEFIKNFDGKSIEELMIEMFKKISTSFNEIYPNGQNFFNYGFVVKQMINIILSSELTSNETKDVLKNMTKRIQVLKNIQKMIYRMEQFDKVCEHLKWKF